MIAVIALNKNQFDQFLQHWVSIKDKDKFYYVKDENSAMGRQFKEVIRIGNYYDREDFLDLYQMICLIIDKSNKLTQRRKAAEGIDPEKDRAADDALKNACLISPEEWSSYREKLVINKH